MSSSSGKTTPCPFCKRPLNLEGQPCGKMRCRQCRNFFSYNALTGAVVPLAPGNSVKIQPISRDSRFIRRYIGILSLGLSLLALGLTLWLTMPGAFETTQSDHPDLVLDEISNQLQSLAE